MNKKILKPFKQMRDIKIFLFFMVFLISCNGQSSNINDLESKDLLAITNVVFVDDADKFEYAVGIYVVSGTLSQNQYIQATGQDGSVYFFQVKEIKVDDQIVNDVEVNANAFIVLQSNKAASLFNADYSITNATMSDFINAESSEVEYRNITPVAKWSFNIDGQPASTLTSQTDNDEPIVLLNTQTNQLTFSVYGDIPGSKRRGMLTIIIENWTKEKGQLPIFSIGFVRYKDISGNELAQWKAKPKTSTITLENIIEGESNVLGKTYYISGIWTEVDLQPSLGYEKLAGGSLKISEGKFDTILVQEMYSKDSKQ